MTMCATTGLTTGTKEIVLRQQLGCMMCWAACMRSGAQQFQTKRGSPRHCKSICAQVLLLVDTCHKIDNAGQVRSSLGGRSTRSQVVDCHGGQAIGQAQEVVEEGMVVVEWPVRLNKAPVVMIRRL